MSEKKIVAHTQEAIYEDFEGFEGNDYKSSLTDDKVEELTNFENKTIYEAIEMYKELKDYIDSDFLSIEEYFYSSKAMLKDATKLMKKNYIIMRLAALKYSILMDEELTHEYLSIASLALKNNKEYEKDKELINKLEYYLKALKLRGITCFDQEFLDILAYITDKVTMSFDNFNKTCEYLSIRLNGISSYAPENIDEFYGTTNEKIKSIIKQLGIK